MGDLYDVGAGCELEPVDFQMYRFRATFFLFSSANDRVPIRFLVGAEWDTDGFAPADGSDSDDCAPGLVADDARRAAATAHLAALEVAVIDGAATDEQIAEYVVLRDASWARDGSRIVAVPAPEFYGYDRDFDRPSPGDDITRAAFDELDRER